MRNMRETPIGRRPTRPLVGHSGSITAINRDYGTTRSVSAMNFAWRALILHGVFGAGKAALADVDPDSVSDAFWHQRGMPYAAY